jgi:hypothetical protein
LRAATEDLWAFGSTQDVWRQTDAGESDFLIIGPPLATIITDPTAAQPLVTYFSGRS